VVAFELGTGQFGKDVSLDVVGSWDVFDADLFEGGLNDCTDQMVILLKDGVFDLKLVV